VYIVLDAVLVCRPALLFLRPTNPAGLDILAQCPRPRDNRCKTSCVKRFIKINVYLILLLDRVLEAVVP